MHYPMFDARDAQGEQEREGCSRHERGHERLLLQEAPPLNFAVSQLCQNAKYYIMPSVFLVA